MMMALYQNKTVKNKAILNINGDHAITSLSHNKTLFGSNFLSTQSINVNKDSKNNHQKKKLSHLVISNSLSKNNLCFKKESRNSNKVIEIKGHQKAMSYNKKENINTYENTKSYVIPNNINCDENRKKNNKFNTKVGNSNNKRKKNSDKKHQCKKLL